MPAERVRPEISHGEYEKLYKDRLNKLFGFYSERNIDARLAGSLGRDAALRLPRKDYTIETDKIKDIDIVIYNAPEQNVTEEVIQQAKEVAYPIPVDTLPKQSILVTAEQAAITHKAISLPVDQAVFDVHYGEVMGATVPTFDPNTLFHMTALYGKLRPKEQQQLKRFLNIVREREIATLPEELFMPFHDLIRMRREKYPVRNKLEELRLGYYQAVPPSVRGAIYPITSTLWNRIQGRK